METAQERAHPLQSAGRDPLTPPHTPKDTKEIVRRLGKEASTGRNVAAVDELVSLD